MKKLYIPIILSLLAILPISLHAADLSKYDLNEQGSTSSSNPNITDLGFESMFLPPDDLLFDDSDIDIPLGLQNEEQLSDLAIQRMLQLPIDQDEEQLVDIEMIDTPESSPKSKIAKKIQSNPDIQEEIRTLAQQNKTLDQISETLQAKFGKQGLGSKTIRLWLKEQNISRNAPKRKTAEKIQSNPDIQEEIRTLAQQNKPIYQISKILQEKFGKQGLCSDTISVWFKEQNISRNAPERIKAERIQSNPDIQKAIRALAQQNISIPEISEILQEKFGKEGLSSGTIKSWLKEQNIPTKAPERIKAERIQSNPDIQEEIRTLAQQNIPISQISKILQEKFGKEGLCIETIKLWLDEQNISRTRYTERIKAARIKSDSGIQARIRTLADQGKSPVHISNLLKAELDQAQADAKGVDYKTIEKWLIEQNIPYSKKGLRVKAVEIKRNPQLQARIKDLANQGKTPVQISNILKADHYKKGIEHKTIAAWLDEQNIPYSKKGLRVKAVEIKRNKKLQNRIRTLAEQGKSPVQISNLLKAELAQAQADAKGVEYKAITAWLEEKGIPWHKRTACKLIEFRPEIQERIRNLSNEGKNDTEIALILQGEFGPEGPSKSSVRQWINKNIIRSQID